MMRKKSWRMRSKRCGVTEPIMGARIGVGEEISFGEVMIGFLNL